MAMGSQYQSNNNQNKQGLFEPSYYPRLRVKNVEDSLVLAHTFWKGSLKLSITDMSKNPPEEIAYIHLSPTKAHIFAGFVKTIIDHPKVNETYGVSTGSGETAGLLVIGRNAGRPFIFMARVNPDGTYNGEQKFVFNKDYHYGLKITDLNSLSFNKSFDNDIELLMLYDLLIDFARSSNGAYAFAVHDVARYESAKIFNMVKGIAEKVGSYTGNNKGYNNGGNSQNSYFNKSDSSSSSNKTETGSIDDLEADLMGD